MFEALGQTIRSAAEKISLGVLGKEINEQTAAKVYRKRPHSFLEVQMKNENIIHVMSSSGDKLLDKLKGLRKKGAENITLQIARPKTITHENGSRETIVL